MTGHKHLVTVSPEASLTQVKEIFDTHSFHHLPVVHFREIVGIISKMDLEHFMGGLKSSGHTTKLLEHTKAEEIMTKRLGKVEPDTRLNVVVEIFTINRFHALPVVENGELVGIITPYDILKALGEEKPADPSMVYENL